MRSSGCQQVCQGCLERAWGETTTNSKSSRLSIKDARPLASLSMLDSPARMKARTVFTEANWVDVRRIVPMMRWRNLKVIITTWLIPVGKGDFFLLEN